mgnify:CR=1 FL=1
MRRPAEPRRGLRRGPRGAALAGRGPAGVHVRVPGRAAAHEAPQGQGGRARARGVRAGGPRLGGVSPAYDERVRSFLHRSQRVFGRTCLALSGGGGLANFSWGVARALLDEGLLPSLICGTSAGAVVAAACA